MEYVIFSDESDKRGQFYSNFFGGVLVKSTDLESLVSRLNKCKVELNMFNEIKWQKVSSSYLEKYKEAMNVLFDEISKNRIKVRIMFTSNQYVPQGLTVEQKKNSYHLLYYQFIKHAFGLQFSNADSPKRTGIRLNIDQMPTSDEEITQFKSYLVGLNQSSQFKHAGIFINPQQIAQVRSHEHVLMQYLDVILGAMVFRLNDKHKVKDESTGLRGKKTIAKEKLYKHILRLIKNIYPNFNIGKSTGIKNDLSNRWRHPYRHWCFVPNNHVIDNTKVKA